MTDVAAHGLSVSLLPGWEARIFRRQPDHPLEGTHPILHLANFTLPEERGDFGGGVTERMAGSDVFVCLFEYGPESLGKPLFAHHGMPRLRAGRFSPASLQRTLPGQAGCQLFFTEGRRPFCLYAVVADHQRVPHLVDDIGAAVSKVRIVSR